MDLGDLDLLDVGAVDLQGIGQIPFSPDQVADPQQAAGVIKFLQQNPVVMQQVAQAMIPPRGMPRVQSGVPNVEIRANRVDVLGLGTTVIGIGAVVRVTVTPQAAFKPKRLMLDASVALVDIVIDDIFIGNQPQAVARGGLPGTFFAFNAVGTNFDFDTCDGGIDISFNATNNNAAAQNLLGGFKGASVTR